MHTHTHDTRAPYSPLFPPWMRPLPAGRKPAPARHTPLASFPAGGWPASLDADPSCVSAQCGCSIEDTSR
eukprot:38839-Eustigmatos_ZCMA.PRE.1